MHCSPDYGSEEVMNLFGYVSEQDGSGHGY